MNARQNEVCLLYSESDKAIASLLEDALNYYSINVWQAQNISIGSKIINQTTEMLDKAKFVIVLWSNNSVKSALLKSLASEAKKNNKILIPVLIENIKIPGEFLDIQPAYLLNWDGDHENEQIVKLWRLIQDKVLKYRSKKVGFNQFIAILGLVLTGLSVIIAITTPEVRCFFKLQCSENTSSEKTLKSSEVTSQSPTETDLPNPIKSTPTPQPIIENPLPNKTPAPTLTDKNNPSIQQETGSQQSVEVEGFIFKLKSCKRLNENVKCDVLITNTLKDRELRLYGNYTSKRSKFLDLEGITYPADSVEIDAIKNNYYVSTQLIQNANVRLSVSFIEIPLQVNKIQVLNIEAEGFDSPKSLKDIQFRDIVLSK
ncbi:toll/interleukin-1 receptor domain-containing protein [Nostoc sp. 'Peltigera membranacea cyanobiont' N6]|uniref:toll/interleukin-1 receptor domain-containing protein n=1 Tax=Nostoc sp. 'Peltigera membranacea cyanobiont' N6 TaxID=1261031 RepID=UPI000CF3270A|nr:toll/interleukin-1 receptor domain-containing protein [Nostoc sp. 'Peltigera membranacea cyanobiont' N6]AVH66790.1 TIR domain protein [Nostoc sp. 'Peltigera membranacea cyanobiont' N6]